MSFLTDFRRSTGFSWSASFREVGLLLLVTVLATGVWWARSPDRLPLRADPMVYELELEAPLLTVAEALVLYDEGVHLFVDIRVGSDTTIPGALFVREATFDDDLLENFDFMYPEDEFILFGDGNLMPASNIAGRLHERGFENVHILQGGLSAWQKGGGDTSAITGEAGS